MKTKTYWLRIATFLLSGSILFLGWFYDNYLCFSLYNPECLFDQYRLVLIEPAVIFSIFLLIISPFLFFINDKIFLKWLRFAGVWIVLSILAIIITPSHSEGILSFGGPSKELVSIWMGALFVILSLAKITLAYRSKK